MSEISKARERMFKKAQGSEKDQRQSIPQPYHRKFTVSSLTQNLQHKFSVDNISPSAKFSHAFGRFPDSPSDVKTSRNHLSRSKQNSTPFILKTINIKIHEINNMDTPHSRRYQENEMEEKSEAQFYQSPPKINYTKKLHKDKIDLILAPPQARRHLSPFKPRQCMQQWAQTFVQEQRIGGSTFVDDTFPPSRTIIFNKKILYQEQGLRLQRLSQIYHNDIAIVNNCEPTLVSIGKYTNPYLYSALTILSEDPSRILSLFGGQQSNQNGIYYVNLCKDGVWRYIIVDDFVPVKLIQGKKLKLYLRSKEVDGVIQIWCSLIEKAISKIYGTYLDLAMVRSQGMSYLFKILTGAPSSTYILNKDFRSYLILIDAALKRKHIVTLEMISEQNQQTAKLKNLQIHQAYKVLEIKKSGLKLRNYNEPDLVTKLAFDQCLIFSRLIIYRLETNYRYITHKLRHKKRYFSKVSIHVTNKTRGYFQVWQNNPAYYKKHIKSDIQYKLGRVKVWIGHEEEDDGDWVDPGKEIQLLEGNYELHVHLCQQKEYDFTLSYYGEKQITMERKKNMEEWYEPCLCVGIKNT